MTNKVNVVEANNPKISAQASPEKMGSMAMGHAPKAAVSAVKKIGLNLTAPLSKTASLKSMPDAFARSIKLTKITEFLITMPPNAM